MFKTLKDLLDSFIDQAPDPDAQQKALQLATAVLLTEIMLADERVDDGESRVVRQALRRQFSLDDPALDALLIEARESVRQSNDFFHYTSQLNDHFSQPQKIGIVEAMWQVAYVNGHVDANEHHLISKIAGLLHVTQGEYISAKLHAKAAAQAV